jgi:hypothetical protein
MKTREAMAVLALTFLIALLCLAHALFPVKLRAQRLQGVNSVRRLTFTFMATNQAAPSNPQPLNGK